MSLSSVHVLSSCVDIFTSDVEAMSVRCQMSWDARLMFSNAPLTFHAFRLFGFSRGFFVRFSSFSARRILGSFKFLLGLIY